MNRYSAIRQFPLAAFIFILLLSVSLAQEAKMPLSSSNSLVPQASPSAVMSSTSDTPASSNSSSAVTLPPDKKTNISTDLASDAVDEKLPQVSASILRTQLQQEKDPVKRHEIALKLSQILVTEKEPQEALVILTSNDLSPTGGLADERVVFWKAQALLAQAKSAEARTELESLLVSKNLPEEYADAAHIALARVDRSLGDFEKGLVILDQVPVTSTLSSVALQERCADLLALQKNRDVEELLKNKTPEQFAREPRLAYLFALAAWQRGDRTEALKRFHKIETTDHWVPSVVVSAIAITDASKPAEAQALLEKYLQDNPKSPRLAELMDQLEQLYLLENNNDVTLFRKWSEDGKEPLRASYAQLSYARVMERLGHADKASGLFTSFLTAFPNHPRADEARLELAENKLNQGDAPAALALVEDRPTASLIMRARYAFVRGLAASALKNQDLAQQLFDQAASFDAELSADALYNKSLIRLLSSTALNNQDLLGDGTKNRANSSSTKEQEEYMALLHADHGDHQSAEVVIKMAHDFLAIHSGSSFTNQVRMKLGEALLLSGNTRGALVELERVGRSESSSELGRQALLLAAQASAHSMDPQSIDDALMMLEQVAQSNNAGADRWQARFEQATLKNAQLLPLEAISIYDQILVSSEVSKELRDATLMAKGDTLSGLKDTSSNQKAIATWRELADASATPPRWRNQALCKIGLISEKEGDTDASLAAFYEAMKTPRDQEPEQLWHDKAFFEAARLLESKQQWSEASHLYQQVIDEKGPRATEAQKRLSKLRLENFLWEN